MSKVKKLNRILIAAILLCVIISLPCFPAHAAENGSITVLLQSENNTAAEGENVKLSLVAVNNDAGMPVFEENFKNIQFPAKELLLGDRVLCASWLCEYALQYDVASADMATDKNGTAAFTGLEKGIYLVYTDVDACKDVCFEPFLVFMPSEIDHEFVYDITAQPKTTDIPKLPENEKPKPPAPDDEESEPSVPGGSEKPADPSIPQTGKDMLPVYIIVIAGEFLLIFGIIDMLRGKKHDKK